MRDDSIHRRLDHIETVLQQVLTAQQDLGREQASEWMDSSEACKTLSCSESQLRRARNKGVFSSDAVVNIAMGTGRPTYRFHRTRATKQYFKR
ncbi:MAG TPA: hypothetical protein ACN46O_08450 [Prochlorococcus sp.]